MDAIAHEQKNQQHLPDIRPRFCMYIASYLSLEQHGELSFHLHIILFYGSLKSCQITQHCRLTISTNIKAKMCYFTSNRLLFDSNFFPILISGGSAITLFKLSHNCTSEVFSNRGIDKYKGIENDEINDESNLRRTVRLMTAEACLPTPLSATHRYLPVSSRPTQRFLNSYFVFLTF